MDPEGGAVKISSGKRFAACEEWMRNRRICGKLTIDTAVFIYKMLGQKSLTMIHNDEVNFLYRFLSETTKNVTQYDTQFFAMWGSV